MPGTAEHRMVRYPILDAEFAKPSVCEIDLHLRTQLSLRADRKHVAHQQHPDHQHRINRRPAGVRVVRRKLLVHPIQVEDAVDLSNQMIRRHHLVEIERVEQLALPTLSLSHHRPLPRIRFLINGITARTQSQREFCNTIAETTDTTTRSYSLRVDPNGAVTGLNRFGRWLAARARE